MDSGLQRTNINYEISNIDSSKHLLIHTSNVMNLGTAKEDKRGCRALMVLHLHFHVVSLI